MKKTKHFLGEGFQSEFHSSRANALTNHAYDMEREHDKHDEPSEHLVAAVRSAHAAAHEAHRQAHEEHLKEHEDHMRAYFHEKFNPNKNHEHHESALEHHKENAEKSLSMAHEHADESMRHKRTADLY